MLAQMLTVKSKVTPSFSTALRNSSHSTVPFPFKSKYLKHLTSVISGEEVDLVFCSTLRRNWSSKLKRKRGPTLRREPSKTFEFKITDYLSGSLNHFHPSRAVLSFQGDFIIFQLHHLLSSRLFINLILKLVGQLEGAE